MPAFVRVGTVVVHVVPPSVLYSYVTPVGDNTVTPLHVNAVPSYVLLNGFLTGTILPGLTVRVYLALDAVYDPDAGHDTVIVAEPVPVGTNVIVLPLRETVATLVFELVALLGFAPPEHVTVKALLSGYVVEPEPLVTIVAPSLRVVEPATEHTGASVPPSQVQFEPATEHGRHAFPG